jgi:hypothetical protein
MDRTSLATQSRSTVNQIMVRYRVKPEHAERNKELVRGVYAELHRLAPAGFHYGTFVLEDGVSFVHLASSEDGNNPLPDLAAFQAFQAGIAGRCDEPPQAVTIQEIGSYRFWEDGTGA